MKLQLSLVSLMVLLMWNHSIAQTEDSLSIVMSRNEQIIVAADAGDTVLVSRLVKEGADVDAETWEGVTPLMYATQNANLPMMKLLTRYGADPDKKPVNGLTALITAIRNNQPELVEFLIRSGASPDLADNDDMTPLMHAIVVDSFYLPDLLLYYGASIEPKRRDGMNALMLSSFLDKYAIAVRLIELGANVNAADKNNRMALHYAAMAGHTDIIELLIGEGAYLEAATSTGMTPLAIAVANNNFSTARILIAAGADVNSQIRKGLNPLALAEQNRNDSILKMLRNNGARSTPWPGFSQVSAGLRFSSNMVDMFTGFQLGLSDKKYNLWTSLGYDIRPKSIRILESSKGNNYFQYWERRHLIYIGIDKAFLLPKKKSKTKWGIVAGFQESITFGSYRGSFNGPDTRLLFSPHLGAAFQHNSLRLRLNYAYMDLHLENLSNNWCTFSVEWLFDRKKGNIKLNSVNVIKI